MLHCNNVLAGAATQRLKREFYVKRCVCSVIACLAGAAAQTFI
tara:strand:- start:778 stop:906 length:129 start_codon:yes stop_codon:yes gene_type:complete